MSTILRRVSDGFTYAGNTDLCVLTCPACGVTYAIPSVMQKNAQETAQGKVQWFCPNGHQLGYHGESAAERERKRAEQAKETAAMYRDQMRAERDLRQDTERRLSAQKGATTRAKKRHAAGVCPVCKRTFSQMQRHMENKHPDYKPTP
jgi:uncharacterized protein YbaR (Trm112 family)